MTVMSEQASAVKAKYQGVEDRRTRLAMLEEANKQLREKLDGIKRQGKEQDSTVDDLKAANAKLKRRLADAGKAATRDADDLDELRQQAQALENENAELKEELLEVTMVLEQVGNTPAVPEHMAELAATLENPGSARFLSQQP